MAKGRQAHQAALQALNGLGKDLSRRARSGCELCGESDGCRPQLVPPVGEDLDIDSAILACPRCREAIDGKRLPGTSDDYRFLETAIWAEIVPAQVAAIRLLRRLAQDDVPWAREANEGLWLDEAIAERVDAS